MELVHLNSFIVLLHAVVDGSLNKILDDAVVSSSGGDFDVLRSSWDSVPTENHCLSI